MQISEQHPLQQRHAWNKISKEGQGFSPTLFDIIFIDKYRHYLNNRSFINMFAFINTNTLTLYPQFQFQKDQPFSLQITTIQSTTSSFQMGEVSVSINMYNSTFKKIIFDPLTPPSDIHGAGGCSESTKGMLKQMLLSVVL